MKYPLAITLMLLVLTRPLHTAEIKPEAAFFAQFWTQFKAAVASKNKEAIASMTKFPFNYGKKLTRAEFIKQFDVIFNPKVRKCFRSAKPEKDTNRESYTVICGDDIFTFTRENGEYRCTDVDMND
jgi:hypothetical protein